MLELLTGDPSPVALPAGILFYYCSNGEAFAKQMSCFDEWGLVPAGHEGPRENPVVAGHVLAC